MAIREFALGRIEVVEAASEVIFSAQSGKLPDELVQEIIARGGRMSRVTISVEVSSPDELAGCRILGSDAARLIRQHPNVWIEATTQDSKEIFRVGWPSIYTGLEIIESNGRHYLNHPRRGERNFIFDADTAEELQPFIERLERGW